MFEILTFYSGSLELLYTLNFIDLLLLVFGYNIITNNWNLELNFAVLWSKRKLDFETFDSVNKKPKTNHTDLEGSSQQDTQEGSSQQDTIEGNSQLNSQELLSDPFLEEQIVIQLDIGSLSDKLNSEELSDLEKKVVLQELIDNTALFYEKEGDLGELDVYGLISNKEDFDFIKEEVKKKTGIELQGNNLEYPEQEELENESDSNSSIENGKKGGGGSSYPPLGAGSTPNSPNDSNVPESNSTESSFSVMEKIFTTLFLFFSRFVETCAETISQLFNNF